MSSMSRYLEAENPVLVQPYSQPDLSPKTPKDRLDHTCTDASSLECQKCCSEVEDPVVDQSPNRNIAQKYSIDPYAYESSPPADHAPTQCFQYCNLPDDQCLRRKAIAVAEYPHQHPYQVPIPDPTKRTPAPRSRLRQASGRHVHPKTKSSEVIISIASTSKSARHS